MKKKINIILPVSTLFFLISGLIVYATTKSNEQMPLFTNNDKIMIKDSYVENTTVKPTNKNITKLIQDYLTKYNLDDKVENYQVKYIQNNIDSQKEMIIETDDYIITLNSDTNEFISYVSKKNNFLKNEFSEEETNNIANNIFKKFNIYDANNYKLVFFEKFDEEIWMVGYAKKYGELINTGEQIRFCFAPQTKEIVTLAVNNTKYDNNAVIISESDVRKIAEKLLDKSVATEISKIYIDIVRPNEFLEQNLKNYETYVKKQYMRKAYVCEFNNNSKTSIYIDCENGQILGGSILLGGEF